jgi:hypothetical protein
MLIGQMKSIVLMTRQGNPIENTQCMIIDDCCLNQFKILDKDYPESICKWRSHPTGIYNCHGMVFASRRTQIHESSEINKILMEDGYVEIKNDKDVLPGDIVLYLDLESGDILHSAIVIIKPSENMGNPYVLSKWGKWREVLHYAANTGGNYSFEHSKYFRIVS